MASIKDVAKAAGVSISTVSNVINGTRFVSDDLKKTVLDVIKELNYEVDMVARSLKNHTTMTIGVILTSINRIFIPQVISGMQNAATKRGYNLMLYTTNDNFEKEKKYVRMLTSSKVDGIIIDTVAPIDDQLYYDYLLTLSHGKKPISVLSLERDLTKHGISSIFADNILGGYMATNHLIQEGCKKIVHIGGPKNSEMAIHRLEGYKKALIENALLFDNKTMHLCGDFSPISGYHAIKALLQKKVEFDGIFAANDQMAIGAIKAINENKLSIPKDIKIVGYDNTFVSSIVYPPLTTIDVPKFPMGVEAINGLISLMNPSEQISTQDIFKCQLDIELLVRQSTGVKSVTETVWDLEYW